ncbi:MAG: ethanolamine ammonia-lyase subunit EutC [Clostridia bacterium]|nr:ethanolamine ammonia-lyase subunit EutC [Clostridia bacterium]
MRVTEQEIRAVVEEVLRRLGNHAPAKENHAPAGTEEPLPDIAAVDLRRQYLVERPHDQAAFLAMKERTPARIGVGHAGARYRTETMLRFQADHAAAQDAVFSDVPEQFLKEMNLPVFQTACESREEFLTRPDKGRVFPPETLQKIAASVPSGTQVVLYLADGLSSSAVQANAADILPVIREGLRAAGLKVNDPFFVRFGRVATQDQIGAATNADVVCVLLGERPGLVTAESMSAYIAYRPTVGMAESRRTVLANIHRGGTPAVEAGAHIVDLILLMLEKKASGTDLPV